MTKKTALLVVIIISIFILNCFAAERFLVVSSGEESGDFYLDTYRVKFMRDYANQIVFSQYDVWIKISYSPKGITEAIEGRKQVKSSIEGYEDLDYSLDRIQFDIKNGKMRVLSKADYSSYGKILDSYSYDNANWEDVIPDSVGESIMYKIRDYIVANWNLVKQRS